MILEAIVTTLDAADQLNIAPMGPRVEPGFQRFVLRPFRTSDTYRNLKFRGEGVLHVIDDVLLLARSTIGEEVTTPTRAAHTVRGRILLDCCRYYEFCVREVDDGGERVAFHAETLHHGWFRDVFGFNRARNAVLEAAILASRIEFLPLQGLAEELERHRIIVEKTGDVPEVEAFSLLSRHIRAVAARRGIPIGVPDP